MLMEKEFETYNDIHKLYNYHARVKTKIVQLMYYYLDAQYISKVLELSYHLYSKIGESFHSGLRGMLKNVHDDILKCGTCVEKLDIVCSTYKVKFQNYDHEIVVHAARNTVSKEKFLEKYFENCDTLDHYNFIDRAS